ncbi:MAG: nucleotidyltransferase domain-containing protein [Clostridiales bacterium]|nr:nucleotidyltransferase domain-containing protein [Clostridiales bacterium]
MTKKIYSIEEIESKIKPVLDATPVVRAILFGSYARGEANEKSDIDIMIDSEGKLRGFDFFGVAGKIQEAVNKPCDVFEAYELISDGKIDIAIKNTGVMIYGKEL